MNKVDLLSKFKQFEKPFYTFSDLQVLLGLGKLSANKRIIDLVRQGFMIKLGRNIFVPSFWDFNIINIANYLNQPAYLSFESALKIHGIYDDDDGVITFASSMNFVDREIGGKKIIWSKISPKLFWGFQKSGNIMIASPEKAFADLIYMLSFGKGKISKELIDSTKLDKEKLKLILEKYPRQTISYLNEHFQDIYMSNLN